jgi:hypothetical protein
VQDLLLYFSHMESDAELKSLIEENIRIAKENNRLLRAMRRDAWFSFAGKILLWALLIAAPLYIYATYLMPLIRTLAPEEGTSEGGFMGSYAELQNLIEQYKVQ